MLAVRWFFARPDAQEALMVKMTKLRVVQYYGNFSRSAYRQRLRLLEERRGALYTLSVLTLRPADQGHYVCKVQEISKHRNKWTAWSNGSSETEMRGKWRPPAGERRGGQVSGPPCHRPGRGLQDGPTGLEHTFWAFKGHGRVNQAMGVSIDLSVDAGLTCSVDMEARTERSMSLAPCRPAHPLGQTSFEFERWDSL